MPTHDELIQRLGRLPFPDGRDRAFSMAEELAAAPEQLQIPAGRHWPPGRVLDQGNTPQCVAYAWEGWMNASPLRTTNGDAPSVIYAKAQAIDEWAPEPHDGTSVRAGAKIMRGEHRIGRYLWALSLGVVKEWLALRGPVVLGTDWYELMFDPDEDGTVHASGHVAGGHAFLCIGYSDSRHAVECQNSWGPDWGLGGRFWIPFADLQRLLHDQGEACAAVELAVA